MQQTSARVVRVEAAAAVATALALHRRMATDRMRVDFVVGLACFCLVRFRGLRIRALVDGFASEDRDLASRLEREVFHFEPLQENRSALDDVLRPLPNVAAAIVDDDLARGLFRGLVRGRLRRLHVLRVRSAHILSKGLRTLDTRLAEAELALYEAGHTRR